MDRTCENCDHRNVCHLLVKDFGTVTCGEWSGWVSVEEELPKEIEIVMVAVKLNNEVLFEIGAFDDEGGFHDGINPPSCYKNNLLAWRELPKWEVGEE